MAYDLTLTSATFAAGKFSNGLSGGYGLVSGVAVSGSFTIEAWVKKTGTGTVQVAAGQGSYGWVGIDANGKALSHYGNTTDVALTSTVNIADGLFHHLELVYDSASGGIFFVDGVLVSSDARVADPSLTSADQFGVGIFNNYASSLGFGWTGGVIDEAAFWTIARHTSAFTPATSPYSGSETGLKSLWHLDGNGTNSQAVAAAATALTLSLSATTGVTGVPVTVSVSTNAALTGAQSESVALSSSVAGTFSPTSVTLNSTTASATATFTPSATGTATITGAATGTPTLSNGTATYTATASGTSASDNFDADNVGSIAPGWVALTGTWAVGTNKPVSGARSFGTTTNADGDTAVYTGVSAQASMGTQVDYIAGASGAGYGIGARFDAAGANGYMALLYCVSGVLNYQFFKKVSGTFTPLTSLTASGISAADGTTVHAKFTTVGSTLAVYLSAGATALPSTATATFTDTAISTAGYPLIYRALAGGTSAAAGLGGIDNFACDSGAAPLSSAVNSFNQTKILFSPYNWNVSSTSAKTINGGAYFKTLFGGTSCTLGFDMTGLVGPYPKLMYRVDKHGAWITVDLAASVPITIPSDLTGYATHFLEVIVRSTSESVNRWSGQCMIALNNVLLDSGKSLSLPSSLPLSGLFFGDSITEGINTITNSGDTTVRSDASLSWAHLVANTIGAEAGIVGFGLQGWVTAGNGSIPTFPNAYNLLYTGAARSFSPAPDFIVINQGQNDGSNAIGTQAVAVLNALISATPKTTSIFVMRPFSGNEAGNLQSAIAACSDPTRIIYMDTTGFFTSANSTDGIHPIGWENISHIAPLVSNFVRPYVAPLRGTRTARAITLTLTDAAGTALPNLTGLNWSINDMSTPGAQSINADHGTGATTNSSGVMTLSVSTTAASGGVVWLNLTNGSGAVSTTDKVFSGPVTVT